MIIVRLFFIIILFLFGETEYSYSQKIESFSISECDNSIYDVNFINERISEYKHSSDTLTISFDLVENCALNPSPVLNVQNDSLFLELNHSSDIIDMCDCCFQMDFVISHISKFENPVVIIGKKILKPLDSKFILLPEDYEINDTTVFNRKNKDGLKVGFWKEYNSEKKVELLSFYTIRENESITMWRKTYDQETKSLKSVQINVRNNNYFNLTPRQYENVLNNRP